MQNLSRARQKSNTSPARENVKLTSLFGRWLGWFLTLQKGVPRESPIYSNGAPAQAQA